MARLKYAAHFELQVYFLKVFKAKLFIKNKDKRPTHSIVSKRHPFIGQIFPTINVPPANYGLGRFLRTKAQ